MLQERDLRGNRTANAGQVPSQRQAILDAALVLFDRDGYDRTTMKAIAAMCGVTDAAIYYHFPSKRAILDAIWELPVDDDALAAEGSIRTAEELLSFVDRMLDYVGRAESLVKLTTRQMLNGDNSAAVRRARTREVWHRGLSSHFGQVFDPERAAVCSEATAMLLLGAVFPIMFNPRVDLVAAMQDQAYRDHLKQLVMMVLPPDSGTSSTAACAP